MATAMTMVTAVNVATPSYEHRSHNRTSIPQLKFRTQKTQTLAFRDGHGHRLLEEFQGNNGYSAMTVEDVNTLCRDGRLKDAISILNDMSMRRVQVDSSSYASVLQACGNSRFLAEGKLIHARMVKSGFDLNNFIGTHLVIMYAKCGSLVDGRFVFDRLRKRHMFSWTAMIGGYAKRGYFEEALKLYYEMQQAGVQPDQFIFPSVLKACAGLASLEQGKDIHDCIIRFGYESDVFVANALVDMYAKCGSLKHARQVFDKMTERDVVSWNAMITGYAQDGQGEEAVELFGRMQLEGLKPNVISWNAMIAGFAKNGYGYEALRLFGQMRLIGFKPDMYTLASLLSACASLAALLRGKEIHTYIIRRGFELDAFAGSTLVDMYAKCRHMEYASQVFDKISERNTVAWNAMISGYAQNGYFEEAVRIFSEMQLAGVKPDVITWNGMIAGFAQNGNGSEALKLIHEMQLAGVEPDSFSWNLTIAGYAQNGDSEQAQKVLNQMESAGIQPDVVSWNAIISGCAQNGHDNDALDFFRQMQLADVKPSLITLASVLSACASLSALDLGKEIHHYVIKTGFELDAFVGSALVDMYAKCEMMDYACHVFDNMTQKNVIIWNAMIAGYTRNGHNDEALILLRDMQLAGMKPDSITIASVLRTCANVASEQLGKEIHSFIIRNGFEMDVFVGSALLNMYSKCKSLVNARQVFDGLSRSDVVLWNAMIAGYSHNGNADEAFKLFCEMQLAGIKPDVTTWNGMIAGYVQMGNCEKASQFFHQMQLEGMEPDMVSWNLMIGGYAQHGHGDEALQLFSQMELAGIKPNMISWNAIITGYAQNGQSDQILKLFRQMHLEGMKPNSITISRVLPTCINAGALQKGKEIHCYVIRSGLESDIYVGSALIDMYAKCSTIEYAEQVFDKMSVRDVVSWNAIISGFATHGHDEKSLTLFRQMQEACMKPNSATISSVLPACADLAALRKGKEIHGYIIRSGLESDVCVGSALSDMYAKCGSIEDAEQVFGKMSLRDVVSWNVIISGFAMHGRGKESLALFNQMQEAGVKPDHSTFIGVLSACSHAGLVDEGWQYFDRMSQDYHMMPDMLHYACMVDLLGRAGHLDEAQDFIDMMPLKPDAYVWRALLGACKIHCNIEIGERVAKHLFELEPENVGNYVSLSNIYAAAGRWSDVTKVRNMMKDRGLRKSPGCSWIEVKNTVHSFIVEDRSHPQTNKIYTTLEGLAGQMKEAGYVPDTKLCAT